MSALCLCGREKRVACPECGKFVQTVKGKPDKHGAVWMLYASHEAPHCTASHMEYKTCPASNTEIKT